LDYKLWNYTIDKNVGIVEAKVQIHDQSYQFAGFACCMIKRKVFREIGLFDGRFLIGGDLDYWMRFAWYGHFKIEYADDTDIYHSCGGTLTSGALKDRREELDKKYRKELLSYKYSSLMLSQYLVPLNRQRYDEEMKRGWRHEM